MDYSEKKLAILGLERMIYETKRYYDEAVALGAEADFLHLSSFRVETEPERKIFVGEKDLSNYTHVIQKRISKWHDYRPTVVETLRGTKTYVINGTTLDYFTFKLNKLSQSFTLEQKGIKTPKSYCFLNKDIAMNFVKNHDGSLIVKPVSGSKGANVIRVEKDYKELDELMDKLGTHALIFQEDLNADRDYRILIVGGNVIGIMERKKQDPRDVVSNISHGGIGTIVQNEEVEKIALAAYNAFGCDYAGIDVMISDKGIPHVLEMNFSAEFGGFEKASGDNVAKKILEYLFSK